MWPFKQSIGIELTFIDFRSANLETRLCQGLDPTSALPKPEQWVAFAPTHLKPFDLLLSEQWVFG